MRDADELGAQAFGEPDLRELRRRVRAHVRHAALADDRRDDDEMTVLLAPEDRQRGARGVEGAEIIHVHQRPHLLRRRS